MITITGKVEGVVTDKRKTTISIKEGRNLLFVQFQGWSIKLVKAIRVGDSVTVSVWFNGKVSSLGGMYNNIVGKSVELVETKVARELREDCVSVYKCLCEKEFESMDELLKHSRKCDVEIRI